MSEEDFQELAEYTQRLQEELNLEKSRSNELSQNLSNLSQTKKDGNLVEYQLETETVIEKIEHFLRGDIIAVDEEGNVDYTENPDKDQIVLNEYGVRYIVSTLQGYFQKGTFLSNLEEERIYGIMAEAANEIRKYVFCNYEKMGMNTPQKVSRFPSLLIQVFHMMEMSLMRAYKGMERDVINSSNIIMQSQRFGPATEFRPQNKDKFAWYKPKTWG